MHIITLVRRGDNGFRSQPIALEAIAIGKMRMCCNRSGKGVFKNTVDPSINLLRGLYQNISFVYGRTGFVLHVASKGDKVRVTRSTLGRNRKCCCEHQLLLRSTRAVGGLGLLRRCQIKRLLCCVRQFAPPPPPPTFTFQRC